MELTLEKKIDNILALAIINKAQNDYILLEIAEIRANRKKTNIEDELRAAEKFISEMIENSTKHASANSLMEVFRQYVPMDNI